MAAVAFGAAYWAGTQFVRQIFHFGGDVRSKAALEQLAAKLNQRLPVRLDSGTELLSMTGLEGVLVYNYRLVNKSADDVDTDVLRTSVEPAVTRKACSAPELRDDLLQQGVTLRYSYADKEQLPLISFDVTPSDCGLTGVEVRK